MTLNMLAISLHLQSLMASTAARPDVASKASARVSHLILYSTCNDKDRISLILTDDQSIDRACDEPELCLR